MRAAIRELSQAAHNHGRLQCDQYASLQSGSAAGDKPIARTNKNSRASHVCEWRHQKVAVNTGLQQIGKLVDKFLNARLEVQHKPAQDKQACLRVRDQTRQGWEA